MKTSFAAIVLASLLASGAAAQDDLTSEERLAELKARHAELLTSLLAYPDVAKRTFEYKALREKWMILRDSLRQMELELLSEPRIQRVNEEWQSQPPSE
jgi:hypothetical protein